jgi:hypothetical protein
MRTIETESCLFSTILDENLMEELNDIQPKEAIYPQEKVILAKGCDGSCSGCSSCQGIN